MKHAILSLAACALGGLVGGIILAAVIINSVTYFMPASPVTTIGKAR